MQFGIIAAGMGSRLHSEGISVPKPLVSISGEKLIDRLIRIFSENGAHEVSVICNALGNEVEEYLNGYAKRSFDANTPKINLTVRTTPSSMHSLYELSKTFDPAQPFIVTTVDTIFNEAAFAQYISAFEREIISGNIDGMMGITSHIDDEKPLYVGIDDNNMITGFFDDDRSEFVSAGIYGLTAKALTTLSRSIERGESRMRNFQRAIIADGLCLKAYDMGMVLDIDHADDVKKAEEMLR